MVRLFALVTGATGHQGGAVARLLLKKGHRVRALTRKPGSPSARALAELGAEMVQGDLLDRESMARAADGTDSMFAVSTPFEAGPETETQQGLNAADAATKANVAHLVYTSVPRANEETGIPHFDSKMRVEQHIKQIGVPHTIIGPAFFMENMLSPMWVPHLRNGDFPIALSAQFRLHQICTADIAVFAVHVLENRNDFLGRRIDIASDAPTIQHMAEVVSRFAGHPINHVELPIEAVSSFSEDLAIMFQWFRDEGMNIDVEALRCDYPDIGWHRFDEWAREQDWGLLRKTA